MNPDEDALSEMVGAIVLISVLVLSVTIIYAHLTPLLITPTVPHTSLSLERSVDNPELITLSNEGGDILEKDTVTININEISFKLPILLRPGSQYLIPGTYQIPVTINIVYLLPDGDQVILYSKKV